MSCLLRFVCLPGSCLPVCCPNYMHLSTQHPTHHQCVCLLFVCCPLFVCLLLYLVTCTFLHLSTQHPHTSPVVFPFFCLFVSKFCNVHLSAQHPTKRSQCKEICLNIVCFFDAFVYFVGYACLFVCLTSPNYVHLRSHFPQKYHYFSSMKNVCSTDSVPNVLLIQLYFLISYPLMLILTREDNFSIQRTGEYDQKQNCPVGPLSPTLMHGWGWGEGVLIADFPAAFLSYL